MRILSFKEVIFGILLSLLFTSFSFSQESKISISQDSRFEQLLNEKRKMNSSITISDRYKIQVFTGDSETSKKILTDFRRENKNIDGTIVFSTPIYKVWVGNFKTRIDAEKTLMDMTKNYPKAFVIKPNK